MAPRAQQNIITPFHPSLSADRIGTYLRAASFDENRALDMYVWNARLGEAFHFPIQAVEVGLRNRINAALQAQYSAEWWRDPSFIRDANGRVQRNISDVTRRIQKKRHPVVTGRIVANLSFGFWATLLGSEWNPKLWSYQLRASFPHLPQTETRDTLHSRARDLNNLRNRIWHHEPIFRANLSQQHSDALHLLKWICPVKHSWAKPHCTLQKVLRQKP